MSFPFLLGYVSALEGNNYLPNTSWNFPYHSTIGSKTAALVSACSAALGQRQFRQRLGVATQAVEHGNCFLDVICIWSKDM